MSYSDPAIPANVKDYFKSMSKDVIQEFVTLGLLTQNQANTAKSFIDTKYS